MKLGPSERPVESPHELQAIGWVADAATLRFTHVDLRAAPPIGYSEEELLGAGFFERHLHPADRDSVLALCRDVAADGLPRELAHRLVGAYGGVRWFSTRVQALPTRPFRAREISGLMVDITTRKQREDATRPSERRLRAFASGSPSVFFVLDPAGTVIFWEGVTLEALGHRKSAVESRPAMEVFREEPWASCVRRALTGEPVTCSAVLAGRSFEARFVPIRDEAGQLVEVAGFAADVTDQRRAELELTRERSFCSTIVETAGALIVVLDREGRIVGFNPACELATGYQFEEVSGRLVWDFLLAPEEAPGVKETWTDLVTQRRPNRHQNAWITKDGRRRIIDWANTTLLDNAGEVQHVVAIGIDVTEGRLAQEELRRQARRLEMLAEASRVFAMGLDYQATLDTVARLLGEFFGDRCLIRVLSDDGRWLLLVAGYHPDATQEAQMRQTLRRDPQRADDGLSGAVLRTGESLLVPVVTPKLVRSGVQREYQPYLRGLSSLLIAPLWQRGQVIGNIAMLRERRGQPYTREDQRLLEDLAGRAAQAIENARLYSEARTAVAARDEFLSIASHELRTPLAALKLAVQNLHRLASVDPLPPPARIREVVEAAQRQGHRLEKLVAALLDVSRIHLGKLQLDLEEVDLATLAADVIAQLEADLAQAGVVIETQLEEPVVGTWDRFRMSQVVTNLLSNAIKYGRGRPVQVIVRAEDRQARLVVRDQGIGIPPEYQTHIFGRFERAVSSRNYGGLGLGLYIVKRIVEAHGGTVRVESAPDRGSTFIVELPTSGPPVHDDEPAPALH